MVSKSELSWEPDLRLSLRATLQEFVSHDEQTTLHMISFTDQRTQTQANHRSLAESEANPTAHRDAKEHFSLLGA